MRGWGRQTGHGRLRAAVCLSLGWSCTGSVGCACAAHAVELCSSSGPDPACTSLHRAAGLSGFSALTAPSRPSGRPTCGQRARLARRRACGPDVPQRGVEHAGEVVAVGRRVPASCQALLLEGVQPWVGSHHRRACSSMSPLVSAGLCQHGAPLSAAHMLPPRRGWQERARSACSRLTCKVARLCALDGQVGGRLLLALPVDLHILWAGFVACTSPVLQHPG